MIQVNWDPSRRDLRVFAVLWLVVFGVIGYLFRSGGWNRVAVGIWILAGSVGVLGILRPTLVRLVYIVWMGVTYPIGFTLSNVLVAAVYYLVITPVGLIQRVVGRDPMSRRLDRTAATYWEGREQTPSMTRYFRQY